MADNLIENEPKRPRGRPRRHGGYSYLTTGQLPENRRYLRGYLAGMREALVRDLGPSEKDLTAAQVILIDRVVTNLGIVRLIEEHVKDRGIFQNPQGFLNPALATHYLAYNNSIRLTLQALGINKKSADGILDLGKYIEEKDAAKAKGDAEIVDPGAPSGVNGEDLEDKSHLKE